jgi:hypothetical protein
MGQVLKPTESRLRRYFIQFGTILDVQINFFTASSCPTSPLVGGIGGSRQEGYGFITFEECSVAETVLTMGTHMVDGIEVMCSFSTERGGSSVGGGGRPGKAGPGSMNMRGKVSNMQQFGPPDNNRAGHFYDNSEQNRFSNSTMIDQFFQPQQRY